MNEKKLIKLLLSMLDDEGEGTKTSERSPAPQHNGTTKIAILQRGWVCVGTFFECGDERRLDNASVVRTWGTSKGIGELALGGPIAGKTVLDPCGTVRWVKGVDVALIDCAEDKWPKN